MVDASPPRLCHGVVVFAQAFCAILLLFTFSGLITLFFGFIPESNAQPLNTQGLFAQAQSNPVLGLYTLEPPPVLAGAGVLSVFAQGLSVGFPRKSLFFFLNAHFNAHGLYHIVCIYR